MRPQVVSRTRVDAVGADPAWGRPGRGAGRPPLPSADAQRGDRRGRDASAPRSPGGSRAPATTVTLVDQFEPGDAARDVGRRVAADPLRPRRRTPTTPPRRGARARCGASSRPSAARTCSSSAAWPGSRTREDGWEARDDRDVRRAGHPVRAARARRRARGCSRASTPAGLAFLLHEPEAGVLRAQRAVRALARQAAAHGATAAARRARRPTAPRCGSTTAACSRATSSCGPAAPWLGQPVPRARSRSARRARSCSSSTAARPGARTACPPTSTSTGRSTARATSTASASRRRPTSTARRWTPTPRCPPRRREGEALARALPRRALPGARGRAAQRLEVLPLRALARLALRRRAASRAPVASGCSAAARATASSTARRWPSASRRRSPAARRCPRSFGLARPRRRRPAAHGWRDGARRRRVGAMHDYLIVGAGSAGCALAARLTEDPASACCWWRPGRRTPSRRSTSPWRSRSSTARRSTGTTARGPSRRSTAASSTCRAGACSAAPRRSTR